MQVSNDTVHDRRYGEMIAQWKTLDLSDITDSPQQRATHTDRFVKNPDNYYSVSGWDTETMAC